ncbi:STAS domain-containing protein [Indiicoccus explosivorum]|uniref:STAS domain-containing protein n=1 Tax=Indiicoccus explosivorum TaxID=1917864 RepID=UPI000B44B23A|nr:STAS domain-containing protein [Indiicoccus explosivorum]
MKKNPSINIEGLQFAWEPEDGRFLFEGEDAVLFWISSAMKTFFDSIEEVAGEESAAVVLEATGFRQGLVVGEYFKNLHVPLEEAMGLIQNTYGSAGWGVITVQKLDTEANTAEVTLRDSWEHKITVAQGKTAGGRFLPAHYAGIFTGLMKQNIWYETVHHQIEGHDSTVVRYFPSDVTVKENIHRLARTKEAEQIQLLEQSVEEKTKELNELIKEISSPIIPVLDGIVVVPLLGDYDETRAEELISKTLENLPRHKAEYLVLDLTGLNDNFSEQTAALIDKIGSAASLIGSTAILVGVSAQLGTAVAQSGIGLNRFQCFRTLQHGIYYALAQRGKQII